MESAQAQLDSARERLNSGQGQGRGPAYDDFARMRRLLLGLLILGMLGTGAELVLLEHTESVWQIVPLVVLGAGVISSATLLALPTRASLRVLQAVMTTSIAAGIAGLVLHYRGNVEFELEMYPSMKGLELFWNSLKGATPSLAPGSMALFGLLGLASTYRHPLARGTSPPRERHEETDS